jgi:hypothetical protein
MDGHPFDPHAHFRGWRDKQMAWSAAKPERMAKARHRALALRDQNESYRAIAQILNGEGIVNATGKPWTSDNVRKLLSKAIE